MASNQRIDDLIAQQAFEQVERLTKDLGTLNAQMVESIKTAKKYSDTLAGAKSLKDINANSAAATKEIANTQRLTTETTKLTKAQQEQIRLAEKRARIVREGTAADIAAANAQRTETVAIQQNTTALAANEATMRRNNITELQGEQAAARYRAARLGTTTAVATETAQIAANTAATAANATAQTTALTNIGRGLTRGLGYLRTAAYVLPGIGIAGIFNLIYEGLSKLFASSPKFDKFIDDFKSLNSLMMQAGAQSGAEIAKVDALFRAVSNGTLSLKERNEAVKTLQDMYPEHLGNLTLDNAKTAELTEKYKALKQELINIAYVQAGYNKISEATSRIFDDEFRMNAERVNNLKIREKVNAAQKAENQLNASGSRNRNANNDALDAGIRKTSQLAQVQGELVASDKLITDAAKDRAINLQRIALIEQQIDSRVKKSGVSVLGGEMDKPEKVKDTSEEDELRALEYQYDQQIALARAKDKENADLEKEYLDQIKNYRKEAYEAQKSDFETANFAQLEAIQDAYQAELIANEKAYATGTIKKAEYEKNKLDIEYKANRDTIESQLSLASQIIALQESVGRDMTDEKRKLSDLTRKLAKSDADYEIAQLKAVAEARQKQNELIKQFATEVSNFVVAAVNAGYENEKNRIQEQQDAITVKKERDIKDVERSLGTEQEKADKIAIINAQAQAKQDVLDLRKREVQQKQAKFEKAVAIAKTIAAIAQAEVQALAYLSNPFTAPFYPAIAALIAATGAAQLATIIATPIPKYAKGTDYHKGGPMIVGDAGSELVIEPGGRQYITPDKDTLTMAPTGTKVIPNAELVRMIASPDRVQYVGGQSVDIGRLVSEQRNTTAAIKQQRIASTMITAKGWTKQQMRVTNWNNTKRQHLN